MSQQITVRAILLALAASGCSGPITPTVSADADIKAFIAEYNDALNNGSAQQRWDLLCRSHREWFDADPKRKMQLERNVPGSLEIKQITAQGDAAQVSIKPVDAAFSDEFTIHLVREDGHWKVCEK